MTELHGGFVRLAPAETLMPTADPAPIPVPRIVGREMAYPSFR